MKNFKPYVKALLLCLFVFGTSCSEEEESLCASNLYYYDGDGDGYGDRSVSSKGCVQPTNYVVDSSDPDDDDAAVTPVCEKVGYFEDADEDGYGNPGEARYICVGAKIPAGFILNNQDCNDDDSSINIETQDTFYEDLDRDGYGNPQVSISGPACPIPEGYVANALDCDDQDRNIFIGMPVFADLDNDGFGDPNAPSELKNCSDLNNGFVMDNSDCDDTNPLKNPGIENEIPGDGMDNNCDGISGIIWEGDLVEFTKEASVDWTNSNNQDKITDNVTFTRQDSGPMYNYTWWQSTFGEDAEHLDGNNSDLVADFFNDAGAPKKDINSISPSGGTKGVRWAIIKDSIAPLRNPTWANFEFYGTPGNPEHFYSFNNLVNMVTNLDSQIKTHVIVDDFTTIAGNAKAQFDNTINMGALVGKQLMLWDMESDIYVYLKFTDWQSGKNGIGGSFSYVRTSEFSTEVEEVKEKPIKD